jgi:DNA topoisomerase VI subunit B
VNLLAQLPKMPQAARSSSTQRRAVGDPEVLGDHHAPRSHGRAAPHKLDRIVTVTDRLSEFADAKNLTVLTGHGPDEWPLVLLKELVDNGLDAAEAAGVAPIIHVRISDGDITISDNAGGISPATIGTMLDYSVRTSSTEAYASPTRGQQGNAFQTILAMPFALDGEAGSTIIESRGVRHVVEWDIDPIRRTPRIARSQLPGFVQKGTRITVRWPVSACSELEDAKARFVQIAEDYGLLNPHLTLRVVWDGQRLVNIKAADAAWIKWLPSDPTSAHWYDAESFGRLIAGTITTDQEKGRSTLVREFIATFRGMSRSSTQKLILDELGAARMTVEALFAEGQNQDGTAALLDALQAVTKPVKPADLGVIGRDHMERRCIDAGGDVDTFYYIKQVGVTDGLPWVLEAAFAWCPKAEGRRLVAGCNWSPGILNPFRDLDEVLADQRINEDEPVLVIIHLSCPILAFVDRGKSALALDDEIEAAVEATVIKVTASWAKQIKAEERDASAMQRRRDRLIRSRQVSDKEAVYEALPDAWAKASSNGSLPASPRQVCYALRNEVQQRTGKQLRFSYATRLLLDYIVEHDLDWDVVFDDRGHFKEPRKHPIGIGTISVRKYTRSISEPAVKEATLYPARVATSGPSASFGAVLFIEKEGFNTLLEHVELARRFDLAIMSTKGMSTTAARTLVEHLCGGKGGIPGFVLHDFDKAGMSIVSTLSRDTERYQFDEEINLVDMGLRLDDVERYGLDGLAEAAFDKGSEEARRANLEANGATPAEVEFLLNRRVELNAFTSDQFVRFIEDKLTTCGVKKVIPKAALLADTYRAMVRGHEVRKLVERTIAKAAKDPVDVPDRLDHRVAEALRLDPHLSWDEALDHIVRGTM